MWQAAPTLLQTVFDALVQQFQQNWDGCSCHCRYAAPCNCIPNHSGLWTKYPVLHLPWRKCRVIPSNSSEEDVVTAQESRAVKEKGKRE